MNSGQRRPDDNSSYRFPVSVKGVVIRDNEIILLKNDRDEWELPGGKLELGEDPILCVEREIHEELGLEVRAVQVIDSWQYHIASGVDVLIVTYGCQDAESGIEATLSHEHKQMCWFPLTEVADLHMPDGYKRSIQKWTTVPLWQRH